MNIFASSIDLTQNLEKIQLTDMKHFILILSIILTGIFTACENSTTSDGNSNTDNTVKSFTITSGNEINVSMMGGMKSITYTTTGDITIDDIEITLSAQWVKVFDATSVGEIIISAETNETGGTRMAAVTITLDSQVETVVINQSGIPDEAVISPATPTEISIDRAGQSFVVGYTLENETIDGYTYAKFDAEWIYRIDTAKEGEVTFYVATNDTNESRTATIEIGYANSSFDVTLTQAGDGDYNFTASYFTGDYYGDFYTPGAGNYFLKFSDRGYTSEGSSLPFGTYYRIDAYGPIFSDEEEVITLPEGIYTFDPEATYTTWTFVADYTDFFVNDKDGKHTKREIESGTMHVTSDQILLELVIDGEKHNVTYNGSTEVADLRGDINILTTLEDDYTLDLSHHSMIYACQGDWYDYGYMNWVFQIKPDDGVGDCLQIDIITEHSDEESGFAGRYTASEVLATNAFMLGWIYGGYLECSWFFTADQEEIAPLRGGEVTVKHNDDGTYTVDIDVTDDLHNRISGTWTGIGRAQTK